MSEHAIRISFDVRKELEEDINRFLELRTELYHELQPALDALDKHPSSNEYSAVYAATERTCRSLAELIRKMRSHNFGHLSSASVYQRFDPGAAERAEWFVIEPEVTLDVEGFSDGLVELRADRVKGRDALRRYSDTPIVAEKFVDFVRQEQLSGIEF